ncbi:MAG TPA: NAD-dependent epimerase/dehydratase family protein [Solirubrobacterales bacterium]|nr:NAD-dependent epimerase/dehydratase family protein [Solirubrobacterales bacterium]
MTSASGRRIAIAGIATHWGTELARRLARDPRVERIFGLDTIEPDADLERTEFIEVDIRSPVLSRLLPSTEVDTVVHCGIIWYPAPGRPARALHDINVIGSLQLLTACERTETVERVICRGSAAIYGCEPAAPSFFTEEMARSFPLRTRFQRDIGELEAYFENFARRHPELTCCMLRFQPELGADLQSPLAKYLSLPVVPTQLGYDPRLQWIDADDATEALVVATLDPIRGAVNVAPDGSISLTRALRLAGRGELPVPHPVFGPALSRLGGRLGVGSLYGDAVRLLRYGRGVDNRRLREELGFSPRLDAVEVVREFARRSSGLSVAPIPTLGSALSRLVGEPR